MTQKFTYSILTTTLSILLCFNFSLQANNGFDKGEFTVGQFNADFETINDALDVLEANGIQGKVTLTLIDERYEEQLTLDKIAGNKEFGVTIQTKAENAAAIIEYNSTSKKDRVVQVNSADNISFERVVIQSETLSSIVDLKGSVDFLSFNEVIFNGSYGKKEQILLDASSKTKHLQVTNSIFNKGDRGLVFQGISSVLNRNNLTALNNQFNQQRLSGVYVELLANLTFNQNYFMSDVNSEYRGLMVADCSQDLEIEGNGFEFLGQASIELHNCLAYQKNPGSIINNSIEFYESGVAGICLYGANAFQHIMGNEIKLNNKYGDHVLAYLNNSIDGQGIVIDENTLSYSLEVEKMGPSSMNQE